MAKGRPRKTLEQLKTLGVFRPDRHAGRVLEPTAAGQPVKPRGLARDVSAVWDRIVPQLVAMRTVKEIDTDAVVAACETWVLYRRALRQAMRDPCDPSIRTAVVAYLAAWDRAAAKLGMSPIDRAKLSVPPEVKADGIDAFARKRG